MPSWNNGKGYNKKGIRLTMRKAKKAIDARRKDTHRRTNLSRINETKIEGEEDCMHHTSQYIRHELFAFVTIKAIFYAESVKKKA